MDGCLADITSLFVVVVFCVTNGTLWHYFGCFFTFESKKRSQYLFLQSKKRIFAACL